MKHIWNTIIAILFVVALFTPKGVMAAEKEAGATASLSATTFGEVDSLNDRIVHLEGYFASKNSPLTGTAKTFISEADRLGLDWKLVAAIAGTESYFGRHIPANSYNAWGWAIFTGMSDGKHFDGWEDGIETVSEGLKQNYVDRGLTTVEKIGTRYAADPNWSYKVNHFMDEIETFRPAKPDQLVMSI